MSFDQRNIAWQGAVREFRQLHSRTAIRSWIISVEGSRIHTQWGQLGGSMQTATEVCQGVNLGKVNAKSPEQYALERARETCRKKHREGYREFRQDRPIDEAVDKTIDIDNLPDSLCFYKPDNSMSVGMDKKARAGKVVYTRKRNGLAFVVARGTGAAKLYSRRMLRQHDDELGSPLTWDDRFKHILHSADLVLPPNSILLGELVMDRGGQDDFRHVQSITKSLTDQSLLDQAENGYPSFYIWDIAFWDGVDMVKELPVMTRYELIHEIEWPKGVITPPIQNPDSPVREVQAFLPIESFPEGFFKTPEDAVEYAKLKDFEGYVVVDPEGVYGDRSYNFKGKPDRPGLFCSKLKPEFEDDFVAFWNPDEKLRDMPARPVLYESVKNGTIGERSTKERYAQGIKSVSLFQFDKAGKLVFISNVSSGMTEDMKTQLASPNQWPRVWKVIYTDRTYVSDGDDTNALTFARFDSERTDKRPEECVNGKL